MKDKEGFKYGQQVAFRDKRGTVLSRPRDPKGKYMIGCNDGVKRMIPADELKLVPAEKKSGYVRGPLGNLEPVPEEKKDG